MIYDCFLFFHELEVLDIRLHELDSVVDKFVLVESTVTHTNQQKKLFYNENKHLFKKFEKIPLKTLPLTFLMVKFTFMKYFNQFVPNIEKIIDYPIKKMLHARQIIDSDELSRLPSIFFYILYDK